MSDPSVAVQAPNNLAATTWHNDLVNPLRRLAFGFALAYIWVRYSMIHEMVTYLTGTNLKIVYLLAPPMFIGILLAGGVRRTLQQRPAWYWLLLTGWMILAIPFSSWKGGSVDVVLGFLKAQIGLLFVMGGLAMTWSECRKVIYAIAFAAVVSLFTGQVFLNIGGEDRLTGFGTMGNSNDYAALMLLLLPFLLFVALRPKQNLALRVLAVLAATYGLYLILATGSRGAIVALAATAVFVVWRGQPIHRIAAFVLIPVAVLMGLILLPATTRNRLMSLSAEHTTAEAHLSTKAREYLLQQSIRFTFQYPLFGVGPGQFANFEGKSSREEGEQGSWHSTHNVFTQVSSEYGLPGLILFVAILVGTFRILDESLREARRRRLEEVAFGVFCLLTSFVAFTVASSFLNLAYGFYFPAFTGLAVAIYSAVRMDVALMPGVFIKPGSTPLLVRPRNLYSSVRPPQRPEAPPRGRQRSTV